MNNLPGKTLQEMFKIRLKCTIAKTTLHVAAAQQNRLKNHLTSLLPTWIETILISMESLNSV